MNIPRLQVRQRDIDEQIDLLTTKKYDGAVVIIQSPDPWGGPAEYRRANGIAVAVHQANTPLAVRWSLTRLDAEVPWHFIITPLGDADLVADLRDRLTPYGAVQVVDPSRSLLGAFSATRILPGTISVGDIPDTLTFLDSRGGGITPAPAGVLTPDHLAAQLLTTGLGLKALNADGVRDITLTDVLEWSAAPDAVSRWNDCATVLPEPVHTAAVNWLARTLGSRASAAMRYLTTNGPDGLLAWGLITEILVVDPAASEEESRIRHDATVSFRSRTGTATTAEEREGWSTAAVSAVTRAERSRDSMEAVIRTAEREITGSRLDAAALLHRSSVCPGGFAARIERIATALESLAAPATNEQPQRCAYAAIRSAHAHRDAGDPERNRDIVSAEAALRIWQWEHGAGGSPDALPSTLTGWLHTQRTSLSWLNVCINAAWREQSSPALHQVTRRIAERARARVQELDRTFAAVASRSGASRGLAGSTLLVEDVLDRIVRPLLVDGGATRPVLLLVLDGMSTAAADQLLGSIDKSYHGRWQEMATEDEELATALAIYPTVTTKSRASLLSGTTATGGQDVEKRGLTEWYREATKGLRNPGSATLLHKGGLEVEAGDGVTRMIEDTAGQPLVAAVLNTIDDALDKSDPIDRQWSVPDITHLHSLLQAAARAGRTVVLVSDHGHIVDRRQSAPSQAGGNSARWRYPAADGFESSEVTDVTDQEVAVHGDRVLTDDHRAVLAVDEDLRYTARKAGYHGGLALAEASIPVIVLSQEPDQLQERTRDTMPLVQMDDTMRHPSWWELREDFVTISAGTRDTGVEAPAATTTKKTDPQDGLFSIDVAPTTSRPVLFNGLESNPGFQAQVDDVQLRDQDAASIAGILRTMGANNNTIPRVQLQKIMGLSNIQFRGALTKLKRILNIDGVEVLSNRGSDITLNAEQLIQQFGLDRRTTTGR
ncbi:BREX-2 system phosphatase PglZ [Corynebacterium sp. AOP34-AQ2-28]|uniref:BREX-2 system phosphatase PglZ n=1 Tax=Corynebacterium sp. AOP34-AQ2-28 TaxID=3457689 RepID=UPI004033D31A